MIMTMATFRTSHSFFDCGDMAIGVCTSHKIADVLSIVMLITTWAQTARGDSKIVSPQFESAKLFPPKNISGYQTRVGMTKDKIVTKRFVFTNSTVASLRAKYSDNTSKACLLRATRVEGLSAFIWKRYAAVTLAEPRA